MERIVNAIRATSWVLLFGSLAVFASVGIQVVKVFDQ
jgi:hypothetical protein